MAVRVGWVRAAAQRLVLGQIVEPVVGVEPAVAVEFEVVARSWSADWLLAVVAAQRGSLLVVVPLADRPAVLVRFAVAA